MNIEHVEIYGEKAIRNLEFQIQVSRILQIFDEMITKIEILLCFQEMSKNEQLMTTYFCKDDLESLCKIDTNSFTIDDNMKRLIQVLFNTNMKIHIDEMKNNVKNSFVFMMIEASFLYLVDFIPEKNVSVEY